MVLSYQGHHVTLFLWLHSQGFSTIFGHFYRACSVELAEANSQVENATFQVQQGTQKFAVKTVSIAKYEEVGLREDPLNEICIASQIREVLRRRREAQGLPKNQISQDLLDNQVLLPIAELSNGTQPCIGCEERQHFIVSQLANSGNLWELIEKQRQNHDSRYIETINHLFRQMARSVHFLHSINVFHSDFSPENFVINTNKERQSQSVFVIDLGQAKIFLDGSERIRNSGRFGKVNSFRVVEYYLCYNNLFPTNGFPLITYSIFYSFVFSQNRMLI